MDSNETIFRIGLEAYGVPRYSDILCPYYGTKRDIRRLMFRLSANSWTRTRYSNTIEAVDSYDLDPTTVHYMAGQEHPVLTPMEKIHNQSFVMHNTSWHCTCHSGAVYPAKAESIHVDQMLLQRDNMLHRCAKATFLDLMFCLQVFGWVSFCHETRGFPGQISYTAQHGHEMCLYTHLESYAQDDYARAIQDCAGLSQHDLSVLCVDILGEV